MVVQLATFLLLLGTVSARLFELGSGSSGGFINYDDYYSTGWVNADRYGFVGEFENIPRIEYEEKKQHKCLLPCKKPVMTDVRVRGKPEPLSNWILDNCLNLANDWDGDEQQGGWAKNSYYWFKEEGFFCMGYEQREPTSKCKTSPRCSEILGPRCNCPDVEVRFMCPKPTKDDNEDFCESKGLPKYEPTTSSKVGPNDVRSLKESSSSSKDILEGYLQDLRDEAVYRRKLNEGQTENNESSEEDETDPKKAEKMEEQEEEKVENGDKTVDRLLRALLAKKF